MGDNYEKHQVIITDIKMPFLSMVIFMVKWSVAAIPALILFWFFTGFLMGFIAPLIHMPITEYRF